jgi:lysophospholipase L1-like esterase
MPLLLGKQQPDPDRILFWNTHGSQITRWKQWRIVKFRDEPTWRLFDIVADPGETTNLADKHPDIVNTMADRYDAWLGEMAKPAQPVPPPAELLEHTAQGRHARRPFGYGWMTVEEWDKIKHDPTRWSEFHARERILKERNK